MSFKTDFKISVKLLYVFTAVILCGMVLASVFIRFASSELSNEFSEKLSTYFTFTGVKTILILILQECFWILMIMLFAYVPHGRVAVFLVILYKGFSIGIVSSLFGAPYGLWGPAYIFLMLLPPSLFYILSICLSAQISFETVGNVSVRFARHGRKIPTDRRIYLFCFIITAVGALLESCYTPWIYQLLF